MGSFINFYFHFLANSQTWTWPHTGSLNLLMLWNPCDTNSEPGLPWVLTHMFQCVFVAISPLTLLYQGHITPWDFTLTRPLLKRSAYLRVLFNYMHLGTLDYASHPERYILYSIVFTVITKFIFFLQLSQWHQPYEVLLSKYMGFCWNLNFIRVLNVIIVWRINKTSSK